MSNFRKKAVRKPIPGTRTSPQTGQIITSSGNPCLDVIFGGGLPVGSICLIEEDKFVTYSKVLAKYFMAEGVLSKQSLFIASLDDSPEELLKKLPEQCTEPVKEGSPETAEENKLRIAWRYNDLPMLNSGQTNESIGHNFNLMKVMNPKMLNFVYTVTWSDAPHSEVLVDNYEEVEDSEFQNNLDNVENENKNEKYSTLETDCSRELETDNFQNSTPPKPSAFIDEKQDTMCDDKTATASAETSATSSIPLSILEDETKFNRLLKDMQGVLGAVEFHPGRFLKRRNLCRVCITSLGSPQWFDENFGGDMLKFLTILRAMIRSKISVCFITMPMHLVAKYDPTLVGRIRNLVDYSIELESFAGSNRETNPAFKEYNGLFQLHRMAAVNTLSAYMPETTDLAFKLKRKKFVIEKLHLPPEMQDNKAAKQDAKPALSCSSNTNPDTSISMDF